jgi:adenylate kinase family enzyme
MGNSIEQAGDPIPRAVFHVQHKLPYAFLLMAPSGYGKSSISKLLGSAKNIKSVSGDVLIHQVSLGKHDVSEKLKEAVKKDYCHTNIAPFIDTLFDVNLGKEWVCLLLSNAVNQNIIIDAYIPWSRWDEVSDIVRDLGFAPINLVWDMIGPELLNRSRYAERTESYVAQLSEMSPPNGQTGEPIATLLINSIFKNTKQTTKQAYNPANLPADFIAEEYLRLHPDVLKAGMNPSYHYLCHGIHEGRRYK